MSVKVVKKGKDIRQVQCPECGGRWREEYKPKKRFGCPICDTLLEWEEEE